MHEILKDIVRKKHADLKAAKSVQPLHVLKQQVHKVTHTSGFAQAMQKAKGTALIAEIKLASPTHPQLGNRDSIVDRAGDYEQSGADAISFITERHYFKGSLDDIARIKQAVSVPVLQKDFVVDTYQIYEARVAGSDALLLIAKLLDADDLGQFVELALELGVEPVVEINDQADMEKALTTPTRIIAVNARDLSTFKVDVPGACELLGAIPDGYIRLGFSGVSSTAEVAAYAKSGARGVLVGTSLMLADRIREHITSLKGARSPVKVKICGIRNLETAKAAVDAGADYLGFNFVPESRRYIRPEDATKIIEKVRGKASIVGVFRDAPLETVQQLTQTLGLDAVQLHGDESPDYASSLKLPVIKAIAVPEGTEVQVLGQKMQQYGKDTLFLLDRATQGSGASVDLAVAAGLAGQFRCFVAGGLTPDTVIDVVAAVKPHGVDVAGGVEQNGQIDPALVRSFIRNVQRRTP